MLKETKIKEQLKNSDCLMIYDITLLATLKIMRSSQEHCIVGQRTVINVLYHTTHVLANKKSAFLVYHTYRIFAYYAQCKYQTLQKYEMYGDSPDYD